MAGVELKDYSFNGMNAKVYIPDNVNENTEIFVFVHGGSEMNNENRYNDWNSLIENQLKKNGSDCIIVMPTMAKRWDERWASNTMDIVDKIQSDYGVQNENVTSCGFSFGGWGAARTTIENIKRNPGLEPQVLFMLDDYGKSTSIGSYNGGSGVGGHLLSNGGKEALLQNDAIVFSYVKQSVTNVSTGDKVGQLNTLAESGVNVVRVVCDDGGHSAIKNNFFKNGLADYSNGRAVLPDNGYTYQKANVSVDPKTGEKIVTWEDIDVNDIDTREKLYNYFGIEDTGNNSLKPSSLSKLPSLTGDNVFVDLDSLYNWRTQLDVINDESIEQLSKMLSTISSLEDSWEGNFASGFIEECSNMVKDAQKIHNDMKSVVDPLLTEVADVESNL